MTGLLRERRTMTVISRQKLGRSHPATLITLVLAALGSASDAQEIAVQNESGAIVKLTSAEIASLPHQELSVDEHGKAVTRVLQFDSCWRRHTLPRTLTAARSSTLNAQTSLSRCAS